MLEVCFKLSFLFTPLPTLSFLPPSKPKQWWKISWKKRVPLSKRTSKNLMRKTKREAGCLDIGEVLLNFSSFSLFSWRFSSFFFFFFFFFFQIDKYLSDRAGHMINVNPFWLLSPFENLKDPIQVSTFEQPSLSLSLSLSQPSM